MGEKERAGYNMNKEIKNGKARGGEARDPGISGGRAVRKQEGTRRVPATDVVARRDEVGA